MKLRNKKTGEIVDLEEGFIRDTYCGSCIQLKPVAISNKEGYIYGSLAELNEEWEDYKEPKEYWTISGAGYLWVTDHMSSDTITDLREIGNLFETKEEAEKALDKIKAWKRLKDKGFDIESWATKIGDDYYKTGQIVLNLNNVKDREWDEYDQIMEIKNELNILFGGEQ